MRDPFGAITTERVLRIGCWPGENPDNAFVETYNAALRAAGAHVVAVEDPSRDDLAALDVLHIHWPESIFWQGGGKVRIARRALETMATIARARTAGLAVVWMVHNLAPHDPSGRQAALWAMLKFALSRTIDGFMTLSPSTIDVVRRHMPGLRDKSAMFLWHPAYSQPATPTRAAARARFGVPENARIFAFVGQIRPYKGVLPLMDAFRALPDADACLWVCGAPSDAALRTRIHARAEADSRVVLDLRFLPDGDMLARTRAADCVVIPFREVLHSGSLVYALSAGARVLTLRTPFATDLDGRMGGDVVRFYDGEMSTGALAHAITAPSVEGRVYDSPDLAETGASAITFYRSLRARVDA